MKARALFLTLLAATILSLVGPAFWLDHWASVATVNALHSALRVAIGLVIIGVVAEEWELIVNTAKFVKYGFDGELAYALTRAREHAADIRKGLGFAILVVGLSAEFILDPAIEAAQKAVEQKADAELQTQKSRTTDALNAAAAANTKAADLLAENVELERALAPRIIDQGALAQAVNALPRVPLLFSAVNREDPKEIAGFMQFALAGINIGGSAAWQTGMLPPVDWSREGISLRYLDRMNGTESDAKRLAIAICEQLKTQGILANTSPILDPDWPPGFPARPKPDWPDGFPPNAVLISVGVKPNHFWENKMLRQKGLQELQATDFCTAEEAFASFKADIEKKRRERTQQNPLPLSPTGR